jgi:3,4-dihydroxy-2-butanone 4-phosphate synthase/GTP cyclohydrolase II
MNPSPSTIKTGTLRRLASTRMPTRWGVFRALGFERATGDGSGRLETAIAMTLGDLRGGAPLLRIHSQCFTGEVLGSLRCDCRDQLEMAMQAIGRGGRGLLIYQHQEGRGIGLMAKLQAYALQDEGFDTVDANRALGFEADGRDFSLSAAILHDLAVPRVRLLTNNPHKARALADAGIEVVARLACEVVPTEHSLPYLRTKKERLGHALRLDGRGRPAPHVVARAIEADPFVSVEMALDELRRGRMVVVVDDQDRENEGDLVMAAEKVTPEAINFMAMHGRGLICLAMTSERLGALELAVMSAGDGALGGTAFTMSIDAKGHGVTTGISAHDRARTIRAAVEEGSGPDDFARPGHVFPLSARPGGVLERRGHTEAAVDLARLAGLSPAGVICEILRDDGAMARVPDLERFCAEHDLVMIRVADLARHRAEEEYLEWAATSCDVVPVPHFAGELVYLDTIR